VRICIFDLDHTLVQSSLDLVAMALDIRAMVERARGPLPPREDRYRVGELISLCQTTAP
jgi:phosphoserine phosphatase